MASQWFSCKGACTGSGKVSDTVKVDVSKLASDKENVQSVQMQNKTDEALKAREHAKKAQEELLRQQQKEAAQRFQQQKEAAQRLQAEDEAKSRPQSEAERQWIAILRLAPYLRVVDGCAEQAAAENAAAERVALAAAAAEAGFWAEVDLRLEVQRQERRELDAKIVEAQKQIRARERECVAENVHIWCRANGFRDMNSKKKSFMSGSKFPLHEAVAKNNFEMVHDMVHLGMDRGLKNSKGQTAEDIATKMNKKGYFLDGGGSMDHFLSTLRLSTLRYN